MKARAAARAGQISCRFESDAPPVAADGGIEIERVLRCVRDAAQSGVVLRTHADDDPQGERERDAQGSGEQPCLRLQGDAPVTAPPVNDTGA